MTSDSLQFQPSVQALLVKYSEGRIPTKPLGQDAAEQILKHAAQDYFTKKLTPNQLESIGTQLYFELNSPAKINSEWNISLSRLLQDLIDFEYDMKSNGDRVSRTERALKQLLEDGLS